MTLALARTLIRDGTHDDEAVAAAYLEWYNSPSFDIGRTTLWALGALHEQHKRGLPLVDARPVIATKNAASEANGALMRQCLFAIWGNALSPEALADVVRRDTTLTHPNRVCADASCAVILPMARGIREGLDGRRHTRSRVSGMPYTDTVP